MNCLFSHWHAKSRTKKYPLFLQNMQPGSATRILNVGASGIRTAIPEQAEAEYAYPQRITGGALSLAEG